MQFYILTSTDYDALVRHFDADHSNIQPEDAVVVINSLDEDYIEAAKKFCIENKIEYYITESNGTPSKGKNSVLDIFEESKNDYCVMIDGDDVLTPHGVWMYKQLAKSKTPPDAVCLINQNSLRFIDDKVEAINPFTVSYSTLLRSDYYTMFREEVGLSQEKSMYFQDLHYKFYTQHQKYSQGREMHCRVTWLSKKASKFRFHEGLIIGEDTLQMFKLKNEAVLGNLTFYTTDEKPATYLYDERTAGTVMIESEFGTDYEWMDAYLVELEKMEEAGELHENVKLPQLRIDYPINYVGEDYNLTTPYVHKVKTVAVKLPRNAKKSAVQRNYKFLKTIQSSTAKEHINV
mgnify:FL=1